MQDNDLLAISGPSQPLTRKPGEVDWDDIMTWPLSCIVCDRNFAATHSPMLTAMDPDHTVAFCSRTCYGCWMKWGDLIRMTRRFKLREDCVPASGRVMEQ